MPPAPTTPRVRASRTFTSTRYRNRPVNCGITEGGTGRVKCLDRSLIDLFHRLGPELAHDPRVVSDDREDTREGAEAHRSHVDEPPDEARDGPQERHQHPRKLVDHHV